VHRSTGLGKDRVDPCLPVPKEDGGGGYGWLVLEVRGGDEGALGGGMEGAGEGGDGEGGLEGRGEGGGEGEGEGEGGSGGRGGGGDQGEGRAIEVVISV